MHPTTPLSTLLREAVQDAPPDHFEPDRLLAAGRTRVRRRRVLTGLAVAALAGVVVAVPGLLHRPAGTPYAGSAPEPRTSLTLGDATAARPGVDYEVLHTFRARSGDAAPTGDVVRGVLADGRVVVERYAGDGSRRIVLVGADLEWSSRVPAGVGNYLGAAGSSPVFGDEEGGPGLWVLDTGGAGWRRVATGTALDVNVGAQPVTAASQSANLYLEADLGTPEEHRRALLEVDPARDTVTTVARGGEIAAYGESLAWTGAYDAPDDQVTVRDLSSGRTTRFEPGTGPCVQKDLGVTPDRVVVLSNCADRPDDNAFTDVVDRVDVFDHRGHLLTRITGRQWGPVRVSDRFVTIASWKKDEAGTYVYDLQDGRFLRVARGMSPLAGSETGAGDLLAWDAPAPGEDAGATYVVARMRGR